ncbi:MAG: SHOCT domain-containing protein [Dehalococcoidales bacterium]|nr:SHOCT domain-containing protein [Dehalococcoidales bacterium]
MMGYWGFGLLGPVTMILFWGGIVALIVWTVRAASPRANDARTTGSNALEILQQRYARGEITKEEFETIRKDIR